MIALADSRHADKPSQRRVAAATESKARQVGRSIQRAVRQEAMVIGVLAAVTLAAYGFELAHLGAALDDDYWELAGFTAPKWVREGRWGLHLLKTVLFPDRMPPLIPMLLGLAFSIAGILLLLRAWGIASRAQQIGFGAVALTFPGTVFSYVLPILGYGIGIGYFCIGLSLYMYARAVGHRKLMAFLPAAFAIAIYQQLLMALAMAFLIHLALLAFRKEPALGRHAAAIAAVNLLAIATYALGARLFLAIYATTPSPYITGRVELATLTSDPVRVLRGTMDAILAVYLGRTAAYGLRIPLMGILIGTALVGFAAHVWGLQRSPTVKLGLFATALLIMLPPFGLGALTGGVLRMRWLPSLPMAVAGVTLLATLETRRGYQFVLTGVVAFAVGTAAGLVLGKIMYLLSGKQINPLIGAAGISAFPMSARVVQKVGLETNPHNHLLMHAAGANTAGQIASVVAGGAVLALVPFFGG